MTSITISIIIPHYTKTDTLLLERAVGSIPDNKDIQVIVVDNSPISIDKNLFDKRSNVEIYYSDKTKGAGHARNIGLQHAKGIWLLFLDADDFFTDDAFDLLEKYLKRDKDIVFFKMTSVYSDTMEPATRHEHYEAVIDKYLKDKDEYHLKTQWPSPCGKLVSNELVKRNNIIFDEVPASNDVMFGLKIGLTAKKIAADSNYIYCITVEKGSLTNTISLKHIESRFDTNIRKNQMLKEHGYKKTNSVMIFIIQSIKYGPVPFIRLFFKALWTGNLFVGYQNWLKTLVSLKYRKNKNYLIKE
ncbi:MAG: glycosyltransferase [Bacteroidales bacterium]